MLLVYWFCLEGNGRRVLHYASGFVERYDLVFQGNMSTFDNSRKRKNMSMGWCRICKVDCETVEGLDRHSQSREHQKMSLDMVMSIKLQNKKKFK